MEAIRRNMKKFLREHYKSVSYHVKRMALVSLITTLGIGSCYEFRYCAYRGYKKAIYGSVENPKYKIEIKLPKNENLKTIEEDVHQKKNKNWFLIESDRDVDDPQHYAKNLFEELTGKKFPKHITIKREFLPPDVLAVHNPRADNITLSEIVEGKMVITTLLHEFGHVITQHSEQNHGLIKKLTNDQKEISALEEAAAFAFTDAGINYLADKDPSLALYFKMRFEVMLKENLSYYAKGIDDEHAWGAFLFYTIRKSYDDSGKIFNILSSLKDSSFENFQEALELQIQKKFTY